MTTDIRSVFRHTVRQEQGNRFGIGIRKESLREDSRDRDRSLHNGSTHIDLLGTYNTKGPLTGGSKKSSAAFCGKSSNLIGGGSSKPRYTFHNLAGVGSTQTKKKPKSRSKIKLSSKVVKV